MKPIFTALLLATAGPVLAQTPEEMPPANTLLRHEVRISAGAYAVINDFTDYEWITPTPGEQFEEAKRYRGPRITTGTYTASYTYRLHKWFSVGASLSYMGEYFTTYRQIDRTPIGRHCTNYFSVMPVVRFNWLNRKFVRLYSSCGMGVSIIASEGSHTSSHVAFAGQFTPIGISVGRSLFGFAEAGVGAHGALILGIGYSFNSKKARQ